MGQFWPAGRPLTGLVRPAQPSHGRLLPWCASSGVSSAGSWRRPGRPGLPAAEELHGGHRKHGGGVPVPFCGWGWRGAYRSRTAVEAGSAAAGTAAQERSGGRSMMVPTRKQWGQSRLGEAKKNLEESEGEWELTGWSSLGKTQSGAKTPRNDGGRRKKWPEEGARVF
jgi:hypothetical protein